MNLLYLSLLITNACLIVLTLLYRQMRRDKQTVHIENATIPEAHISTDTKDLVAWLDEHGYGTDLAARLERIEQAIDKDGDLTRQRIAQTKTRLADEERADQKEKAAVRRKKAKA